MHELSIAVELVEIVSRAVETHSGAVTAVYLRLGAFSGVERDALLFAYDVVTQDTPLAGSRLEITETPLILYCPQCAEEVQALSIQALCCPKCGTFSADIRSGRELEIDSVEVTDDEPQTAAD